MLKLLVLREQLRAFYGKHSTAITAGIRFLTALVSMICLNSALGYMKVLKSPAIVLVLALISSVCPFGGICWILALFMLAHIFAVSLELALITAAFLLVVALLYYGFAPGDSWIMILTPLLFVLKIPYVAPLLVGLSGALVSVIPLSCGVVVFHLLQYVRSNAGLLTNGESVDITQKYMQMLNGIIMNRTMILYILAFAAAAIVVWLIRNQAFNQAWTIAVIAGILVMLLVFFAGVFLYDVSLSLPSLLAGIAVSGLLAGVYRFFVFHVDYSRTEYTQFEDDEYFYYVKAVPKVTVTAPAPQVRKISTARKARGAGKPVRPQESGAAPGPAER